MVYALIFIIFQIEQKELCLDIKEKVIVDLNLNDTERRANLEEADIIEAVMNLNSMGNAYIAVLSSSSKVLQLSLLDYM